MNRPRAGVAMPEWLSRSDRAPAHWTVASGPLRRGEAYTDVSACHMRIPIGGDETSRCVRAHELMHAKVSPLTVWQPDGPAHLDLDVVVTAEEFRINQLIKVAGFAVDRHLADGSEVRSGERAGVNADWTNAVLMIVATSGTKASRNFFTGIKRTRPEWVPRLRDIDRQLLRMWKRAIRPGLDAVASTQPWGKATLGWRFTLDVARYVVGCLETGPPRTSDPTSEPPGSGSGLTGAFAPLVFLDVPLIPSASGRLRSTRRSSSTGRHLRRLDRLLLDPERRVFDRRVRSAGGVILIDQSGSMRLTDEQVRQMIRAAPGCTVIGYSHEARSTHTPNIWVLARAGRVAEHVPRGNGGNGVDGPALTYAISVRRHQEPLIWVCDGYVTDAHDDHHESLTRMCAALVARHGVHQVPDVPGALSALARASRGHRLTTQAIGPIATASGLSP